MAAAAMMVFVAMGQTGGGGAGEQKVLAGVDERIERNRKVTLEVVVTDDGGKPVPEAAVEIEQLQHEFLFGCNIYAWGSFQDAADEKAYRERFAAMFNYATVPFYWWSYEREEGKPAHERTEELARWCREHGIRVKGHPLAWNSDEPKWLPDDVERVVALQMGRIGDCVGRFAGLIDVWDVVNEAAAFERPDIRGHKLTAAMKHLGRAEFVRRAFAAAKRANPKAVLLINDFRVGADYEQVITELVDEDKRPLYGAIGIQSHMHGGVWSMAKVWEVCEQFARFEVPLHFTEMTVLSGALKTDDDWQGFHAGWESTPEGEQAQAEYVEKVYRVLFSHPAVAAVTWWDLSDARAWQGAPAGLVRKDLSAKPAYERLKKLVKQEWWTHVRTRADAGGAARVRVFRGEHRVTVRSADGRETSAVVSASAEGPNRVAIRLPRAG